MWTHVVRELLLPPTCFLLAAPVLVALSRSKRKPAMALGAMAFGLGLLLSTVPVSHYLSQTVERVPPLSLEQARAYEPDSILVLGAGVYKGAVEMEGETIPSNLGLERCYYAAWLSKQLDVPIVVSGGFGEKSEESEAFAMKLALELWGVEDVYMEAESRNTNESAQKSGEILRQLNLKRSLLVTSASHMARAQSTFTRHGIETLSAPTGFRKKEPFEQGIMVLVPSEPQLHRSSRALRALLAELWYKIAK